MTKKNELIENRSIFVAASLFAMLSVIIGAFAAHGLKSILPSHALQWIETGVRYQFFHAFGLFAIGFSLLIPSINLNSVKRASKAMVLGIVLFSGSLYIMAYTELRWLGMITPIGGVCLIFAWSNILWAFLKLGDSGSTKSDF